MGEINDAARKVFEHAHSAGLTAVIGAVSLLGSVWTLGILRLATCAVLVSAQAPVTRAGGSRSRLCWAAVA